MSMNRGAASRLKPFQGVDPAGVRGAAAEACGRPRRFCGAAGSLILPVNYRVHTGQVVFRTSAYGMLAELR